MPRLLRYEMVRSGVVHLKDFDAWTMLCGVKANGYAAIGTTRAPTCAKCLLGRINVGEEVQ